MLTSFRTLSDLGYLSTSDVTRELVRMWLRYADYAMLCNV
jgi:hypothetical protein